MDPRAWSQRSAEAESAPPRTPPSLPRSRQAAPGARLRPCQTHRRWEQRPQECQPVFAAETEEQSPMSARPMPGTFPHSAAHPTRCPGRFATCRYARIARKARPEPRCGLPAPESGRQRQRGTQNGLLRPAVRWPNRLHPERITTLLPVREGEYLKLEWDLRRILQTPKKQLAASAAAATRFGPLVPGHFAVAPTESLDFAPCVALAS